MRKYAIIFNITLAVAVIGLYVLYFINNDKSQKQNTTTSLVVKEEKLSTTDNPLPVAYINIDSLLLKYLFAKDANERLFSKSEKAQRELSTEMKKWQADAMEFQKKVQSKAFISEERAQQENNRLMQKRQELENLDTKLSQDLIDEQKKLNAQLRDSLSIFLKDYCKENQYQIVLSNLNDNILYSETHYNITSDVIEKLNTRYRKKK